MVYNVGLSECSRVKTGFLTMWLIHVFRQYTLQKFDHCISSSIQYFSREKLVLAKIISSIDPD